MIYWYLATMCVAGGCESPSRSFNLAHGRRAGKLKENDERGANPLA